jgi:hypothetical protein
MPKKAYFWSHVRSRAWAFVSLIGVVFASITQAFDSTWVVLQARYPFRDCCHRCPISS